MTGLDRLIEAVEVGLPSPTNWRNFAAMEGDDADGTPFSILAHRAYHGSLDAAKRLHDALLPERYGVTFQYSKRYEAKVAIIDPMDRQQWDSGNAWINPARAWLLAILRAVKAREGK